MTRAAQTWYDIVIGRKEQVTAARAADTASEMDMLPQFGGDCKLYSVMLQGKRIGRIASKKNAPKQGKQENA
ncbi:MAG: hypothetical protein ACI4OS_05970, partial [Akkermansia sp.]